MQGQDPDFVEVRVAIDSTEKELLLLAVLSSITEACVVCGFFEPPIIFCDLFRNHATKLNIL